MTDRHRDATRSHAGRAAAAHDARPRPAALPAWRVVLHNDNENYMRDVVQAVRRLTPVNAPDAVSRVFEAHCLGQATLLITHRELAEHYMHRLRRAGLDVDLERCR